MQVMFSIGKVVKDSNTSHLSDRLATVLPGVRYCGSIVKANSNQLNLDFDEQLCAALEKKGWQCERKPRVDVAALGRDSGSQEADAIITHNFSRQQKAVLEIEKSNKKTLWFDFIKLWMFIESGQASQGIVLCPLNYAHKLGEWNLYQEATCIKRYLGRFAGVSKEKLDLITVVGFEQLIVNDKKAKHWNAKQFMRVKEDFRRL